jgi:ankyrin repeat protein
MTYDDFLIINHNKFYGYYLLQKLYPDKFGIENIYPPSVLEDKESDNLLYFLRTYMPLDTIITDLWDWDIRFEYDLEADWLYNTIFGDQTNIEENGSELVDFFLEKVDEYELDYNQIYDDQKFNLFVQEEAARFIKNWRKNLTANIPVIADVDSAFMAARIGILPKNFNRWSESNDSGWTVAHEAAENGHLPADFDRWEIVDDGLYSVAHVAAYHGHLSAIFDRWELADQDGLTVAHEAAVNGHLPGDFDRWELADENGVTVAHIAAQGGFLPSDFNKWTLADRSGRTVAHYAAAYGHLPIGFTHWELADIWGGTVAHWAAANGNLPDDFDKWKLIDENGMTVAHEAEANGCLPADFDWEKAGIEPISTI